MTETNEEYHARAAISASDLKLMDRSWRIYEAKKIKRTIPSESTPAMEFGTAVHCAVLEPDRFAADYISMPDDVDHRRNTKSYKAWRETVGDNVSVLNNTERRRIEGCVESLNNHPLVSAALMASGEVERSHYWHCPLTDVGCKFRPDKLCHRGNIILDVKTTQDVDEFAKTVVKFGYHIQAAHYLAGAATVYQAEDWQFIFAAVETAEPYRSRSFILDSEALCIGFQKRVSLLNEFSVRHASGDWSDRDEREVIKVSLPNWYLRTA